MDILNLESAERLTSPPQGKDFEKTMEMNKIWIKNMPFITVMLDKKAIFGSKMVRLYYESGRRVWAAPRRGKLLRQVLVPFSKNSIVSGFFYYLTHLPKRLWIYNANVPCYEIRDTIVWYCQKWKMCHSNVRNEPVPIKNIRLGTQALDGVDSFTLSVVSLFPVTRMQFTLWTVCAE